MNNKGRKKETIDIIERGVRPNKACNCRLKARNIKQAPALFVFADRHSWF